MVHVSLLSCDVVRIMYLVPSTRQVFYRSMRISWTPKRHTMLCLRRSVIVVPTILGRSRLRATDLRISSRSFRHAPVARGCCFGGTFHLLIPPSPALCRSSSDYPLKISISRGFYQIFAALLVRVTPSSPCYTAFAAGASRRRQKACYAAAAASQADLLRNHKAQPGFARH